MTFYEEIARLKDILRRGWLMRNIDKKLGRSESDAEHCFSMIMLALEVMTKKNLNLDQLKVLKMIAYHELCEIDAGDITPFDKIDKEVKHKMEHKCIRRLSLTFNMPEIEQLWLEFEANETPEAKFVKMIDKYDAVMQAKVYSKKLNDKDIYNEFHDNCIYNEEFDDLDL